jgi:hypothetical protein
MARTKGSKNKNLPVAPATLSLTIEERILLIADLIVDTLESQKQAESTVGREFEGA